MNSVVLSFCTAYPKRLPEKNGVAMPCANQQTYAKFRLRLILGFCLLVVLLIGVMAWKILSSYYDEKRIVELQTKNFTQAMSAHVLASIQFMDLSLISTADIIKTISKDSQISPEAIKQLLLTAGRMSDANFWLIFLDAQGRGIAASNNSPVAGISYAERPYFSEQVKNKNLGLYVGGPIVGKASNRRVFALSRRVTSSTGQFLGVVVASVNPNAFAKVFTNALFNPSLNITLAHTEGKIIARVPRFEDSFGTNIVGSPLFKHLAVAPSGSYEAKSVIDGENRIYAYNTIENLPLVVSVGMSSKSLTAGLVDDFFIAAVGLTINIVVLLFSGNYALRSFLRVMESEAKHRQSNDELKAAQESLTRLARVDTLTGLPNRSSLYDRLAQALDRSRRNGTKVGCLYMDIDYFKQINDTLGHAGGDELLKQFGARVQACVRQTDSFARLAGDEFVAVIEDLDQPDAVRLVAAKIIEAMQSPFLIEGVSRSVTASIGVAIANGLTDDPDSLLRKADAALYCAKREGRNLYRLYETQGRLTA
jgi:diguanylate cyclase (GGDEF)-like protein